MSKRMKKNGVLAPKPHTVAGKVWAICEELSEAAGGPVHKGDVLQAAEGVRLNPSSTAIAYASWKKFHGYTKKVILPKVPPPPPPPIPPHVEIFVPDPPKE